MLDAARYLLGVVEIGFLAGFALLGATALRRRLLPGFRSTPAHLAAAVLALALLLWVAELLGTVGLFEPIPYLLGMAAAGLGSWALLRGWCPGGMSRRSAKSAEGRVSSFHPLSSRHPEQSAAQGEASCPDAKTRGGGVGLVILMALFVAAIAVVNFALEAKLRLGTGMTGFDSTWYHGPFAAGFFQSGDTLDLHFIAPQFMAWFYPANAEVFHAIGMTAFDRDILSPLLNIGWFVGCLVAAWSIGRPFGVAPWSLALAAIALSVPAFADQAGEARNDIVGLFFLLAAVAVALNAFLSPDALASSERERTSGRIPAKSAFALPALAVSGLAMGMAVGAKLNFLLPAAVFVVGLALISPRGRRWKALGATACGALAGGGYWYLRNFIQTGNPLPWVDDLGPISLPAPDQALGGREAHSVLDYLTDGTIWSDWFLPGLHNGLWIVWPLLLALAIGSLALCLGRRAGPLLRVLGLVGLATVLAWLIAPTSASGPEGMPRGFESGLRYLVPALVLGTSLLPAALREQLPLGLQGRLRGSAVESLLNGRILKAPRSLARHLSGRKRFHSGALALALLAVVALGYPVQRHYLESRYADPSFTTPGLNAAFGWARDVSDARIATTSTRQYPLFGTDLSNRVQFVGVERAHGGFVAPASCPAWRRALNEGDYDYVVASSDRIEPGKPPYPPQAAWAEAPNSRVVLRVPPTVIFKLNGKLDPSACR